MEGAIARPDVPQHFMVLKPVNKRVVVKLADLGGNGIVLAQSTNAIRLIECGKTMQDPVLYFPFSDVSVPFTIQEKSTYCPLKGDASYFAFEIKGQIYPDLAWSYEKPLDFSKDIAGLMAFYPNRVIIEEHPV